MSVTSARPQGENPRTTGRDPITVWLLVVAGLVILMVIVGGYTRLSRAGLSIVQWDVVTGVLPPIGADAWQNSFAQYRLTPEYLLVNTGMSLAEYQQIFYIEWAHRLIGRIAGLMVVLPLIWFMWKRIITARESIKYWLVAAGFGIQGVIGWVMVSSGLEDRPTVSHFRLTIHLLTAIALLAVVLWMALGRIDARRRSDMSDAPVPRSLRVMAWVLLTTIVLQIAYGGLVAGLKAGHLSNTWPLMGGKLVPSGILTSGDSWFMSLFEPIGSLWIHRWFAFVVAGLVVAMFVMVRRVTVARHRLVGATSWLLVGVGIQIFLGIGTLVFGVPIWLALAHQATGVALFCIALVVAHDTTPTRSPAGILVATELRNSA